MSENSTKYLNLLNKQQREVVENIYGSTLVLAGAGSGKTRVLTFKILHLLVEKLANPNQIMAVTFTNKAASEMKKRISNMLNFPIDRMWIGTFHSLSVKILRENTDKAGLKQNFIIIDSDDQLKLIKKICELESVDTNEISPKYIQNTIEGFKNKGISHKDLRENRYRKYDNELRKIYKLYQEELIRLNCVDFGDLILFCIKLFKYDKKILKKYQQKFKFILVDEYQDINNIQQKWLENLYGFHKNICCVGDDDQSIYSWRGADVSNLLSFEKNFDKSLIIRLEQNYRSTKIILNCASNLIGKNKSRYGKKLWSENAEGEKIDISGFWETKEESKFVTDKIENIISNNNKLAEISILFRVAAHTRSFEDRLISIGLPYKIIGGLRFYERKEIKDIIAFLRLVNNLSDDLAFERIINVPKKGIGKTTLKNINTYARQNHLSLFEASKNFSQFSNSKINNEIFEFVKKILNWRKIKEKFDHIELTKVILEDSRYMEYLQNEEKNLKNPDTLSRVDNINEFIVSLRDFENLEGFLEHVGLVMDNISNTSEDTITLMTMHGAKGLEFDYVFLAGWEEGVFPSQRSIEETGTKGLEEERRLAYVALTRARKKVFITYVNQNRYSYSSHDYNMPSRFISELPKELVSLNDSSYVNESSFLNEFMQDDNKSEIYLSPGRKRILQKAATEEIDWEINQDHEIHQHIKVGNRVFHQKFGYGKITKIDGEKAEVNFEKTSTKNIFIKYLNLTY
ncbi:MAG: DNA helicase II [Pelagibacteraceae bacterium]|nr:DNA helicase II [Pelagibacteraceae bacterium]|tara:strand:- start:3825 stop:6053 length:2229 start_codon:yes stop_codon:yes gene_type:complete